MHETTAVLDVLRAWGEPIAPTRGELAAATGLSLPQVDAALVQLRDYGVLGAATRRLTLAYVARARAAGTTVSPAAEAGAVDA